MRILLFLIIVFSSCTLFSQTVPTYPANVEAVLKKAGKNRKELEKSIAYFKNSKDSLKLKAIYFLISNMDIHYSRDYYWIYIASGKRVVFNELDYPDIVTAVKAFEEIKAKNGNVKPVPYTYNDIDTITSAYLIDNVECAFNTLKSPYTKKLSFEDFCEYILPYRISTEPLQNWRDVYRKRFSSISDSAKTKTINGVLQDVTSEYRTWFKNNWRETQSEPLHALGPLQLLSHKKGDCARISDLAVFILRSQGFPASQVYIPYWATTYYRHWANRTLDEQMKPYPFDMSDFLFPSKLHREPSKVLHITYSKQAGALANKVDTSAIPDGFMRTLNYQDITKEYWETSDIGFKLFKTTLKPGIAYVCVFNSLGWRPTWWGEVKGDSVVFTNMCKGVVFMPMYYINDRLVPAGYPFASGYNHQQVLKADTLHKREVTIENQAGYLIFRPGKNYKLYYWNNKWKLLGQQKAAEGCTEMVFANVPKNALFLLLPEYSEGKERPFMITDEGERVWW